MVAVFIFHNSLARPLGMCYAAEMLINRNVVAVVVIALWLPVLITVGALQGCQTGTTGFFRPMDSNVEHSLTNAVAAGVGVATGFAPQPWPMVVQTLGAAVLALLAAWQGLAYSKIEKIQAIINPPKKGNDP